jgi:hypothetical protein
MDSVAVLNLYLLIIYKGCYDKLLKTLGWYHSANGIAGISELPLVAVDVLQTEEMDTLMFKI